jgi:DNA primase
MRRRFLSEELSALRNQISIRCLIEELLVIPSKEVEGVFRFLCPKCGEFQTAVNLKTNLSRCFRCQENFNTIELVMRDKRINFVDSVRFLKQFVGKSPILSDKLPMVNSILNISWVYCLVAFERG